jgi:hypothetical protein
MQDLIIANLVASGLMFGMWSRKGLHNALVKMMWLGLLVANILALSRS